MIRSLILAALMSTLLACSWRDVPTNVPSEQERNNANRAVAEFTDHEQLAPFFKEAIAYAVYPGAFRATAGIGGGYASGWLFQNGEIIGRTKIYQLSVGVNLGAQWYRQILFFKTQNALKRWQRGTFALTGEANAAAGTWGASATPSFSTEIALFTELRGGLLVEASVGTHRYDYASIETPSSPR